jgi:hypothetical protein
MTQSERKALEARLDLINEVLPMGYTANIGIVLTTLDEHAAGSLTGNFKSVCLADVVINHNGNCIKNRWGFYGS